MTDGRTPLPTPLRRALEAMPPESPSFGSRADALAEYDALLAIAEAAADVLNHGLDHLSGQIKMVDGSVQPCPLCLALDRFKAVSS